MGPGQLGTIKRRIGLEGACAAFLSLAERTVTPASRTTEYDHYEWDMGGDGLRGEGYHREKAP